MRNSDFDLVHMTLATINMPAMKNFYEAVFNADLQAQALFGTTLYAGKLGDLGFVLCPNEIAGVKAERNRHQLRFSVNDIAAIMRSALANGATRLNEIVEQDGVQLAAVRDPDGNSIEFMQARN